MTKTQIVNALCAVLLSGWWISCYGRRSWVFQAMAAALLGTAALTLVLIIFILWRTA